MTASGETGDVMDGSGEGDTVRRRTALLATVALTVTGTGLVGALPAGAATTDPARTVSAHRVIAISGHGWGHGRGMSQNGAYGAAARYGRSAGQILDFYYPGTATMNQGDPAVRVQLRSLDAASPGRIDVENPGTLSVYDEASRQTFAAPRSTSARWRVVPSSTGLKVQYLEASTWTTAKTYAGPVRVDAKDRAATQVLYPANRTYTSAYLRVQRLSATAQSTVAQTTMEAYLRGVVPAESLSSWPAATLQAQSVAARSYSSYRLGHPMSGSYDICDTTACQVYGGDTAAAASTDAAIKATAGIVRTWHGSPIFAEFSSSNGGWTTAGNVPYLPAKADPYDGAVPSTVHSWVAALPASAIEQRYPSIGRLRSLRVTARDGHGAWGGRVDTVLLVGTLRNLQVSGRDVYLAWSWPAHPDGLRSSWWDVRATGTDVTGDQVADLVVGAPGRHDPAAGAGAFAVVPGVRGAVIGARGLLVSQSTAGVPGAAEAGDAYGQATTSGDFDGDGRTDVAVGVPGEDLGSARDAGMVQVLRGSSSGVSTSGVRTYTPSSAGIAGAATTGSRFGAALVAGDVNGDGYDDLVVGWPGATVSGRVAAGAVTLLPGSATGLVAGRSQLLAQGRAGLLDAPEAADRFGTSVAIGDVDGDGRADVAVGSPGERSGTAASGAVWLLRGKPSGLVAWTGLSGAAVGNRGSFGRAVALVDSDRDGLADLVAGGAGATGGAVTVVLGRSNGLTGPRRTISQSTAHVPGGSEQEDTFGATLAAGDLDGDGYGDVAAGNPTEAAGRTAAAGSVIVLYGAATGLATGAMQGWSQSTSGVLGSVATGDRFGASLSVTDLNGDGYGDLAVGVPGEASGRGAVAVLYGSEQRVRASGNALVTLSAAGASSTAGDRLGAAVASR